MGDINWRSNEASKQLTLLHDAILHLMKMHGFTTLLLVARNCPANFHADPRSANASTNLQLETLQILIPEKLKEANPEAIIEWKATGLSASKDEFVDGLAEQLANIEGKALVLTVRPDQMTKSDIQHSRLVELLSKGGHGAMSFQWDHKTLLDVAEAFQLHKNMCQHSTMRGMRIFLKSQLRAPMLPQNLPIWQPVLWILGKKKR
jgi:hypothetical protein